MLYMPFDIATLHKDLTCSEGGKEAKPANSTADDMGLKILPPKSGEILLEIMMRRYENRV
jgi:hypothetical protein